MVGRICIDCNDYTSTESILSISQFADSTSNDDSQIPQLDGNASLESSDYSSEHNLSSLSLPQTDDQFSSLPTIYSANARSVFPKFVDLVERLENSRVDIAQISETWQDVRKGDHNDKIDRLDNQYGYKWYSYARPKYRDDGSITGGGGSAVLVNSRNWLSNHLVDIMAWFLKG